jgi:hypothetical protein
VQALEGGEVGRQRSVDVVAAQRQHAQPRERTQLCGQRADKQVAAEREAAQRSEAAQRRRQ